MIRRTTASILTVLASGCRHPDTFTSWLLNTGVNLVLPLNNNTSAHLVTGVLGLARNLVTHMIRADSEAEPLLLLYEMCIKLTEHKDHNIVTSSLETLAQLLRSAPPLVMYMVTSSGGPGRSRLSYDQDQGEAVTQAASSLINDQSLASIPELGDAMENSVLSLNNEGSASAMDTSNNEADSEGEEPREEIILPSLGSGVKKQIVAEDDRLNVGSFEDKAVSLHYLARKLVSMFLLSEEKGELVSDRVSRVSVKTLTVNCLVQVAALCPQVWSLALAPGREDTLTNVDMSDLLLYLNHQDPSLLHRFKDVLTKYIADEKLSSPVPLASHRMAEFSFVLKSITTCH